MTAIPLRPLLPFLLALGSVTLAACGGGGDGITGTVGLTSKFRAVNGISDSPTSTQNSTNPGADVSVAGQTDPRLQDLGFLSASVIRDYAVGSYSITYTVRNSAGAAVVATAANTPITASKLTTTYGGGLANSGTQMAFAVQTPTSATTTTGADILVVHDASSTAGISVYITTPSATFPGASTPINLSYMGSAAAPTLPGGTNYRIYVTQQGQPSNVLFDSGPNGIPLSGGVQYQISTMDNPSSQGSSTLYVFLVSDSASDTGGYLVNGGS